MTEQAVEIWTSALENVLRCVPIGVREQVLSAMLKKQRERQREPSFKILNGSELHWDAENERNYRLEKEAIALMVQVLVRSVTNSFSKKDAARMLFRDHYGYGTGSGWLPDYLDGLPGITVDKKQCVAISEAAGAGALREVMTPERSR